MSVEAAVLMNVEAAGPILTRSDWRRAALGPAARRPAPNATSHGYIAQWLERLTADQQVPGSNPGVPFERMIFGKRPTAREGHANMPSSHRSQKAVAAPRSRCATGRRVKHVRPLSSLGLPQ